MSLVKRSTTTFSTKLALAGTFSRWSSSAALAHRNIHSNALTMFRVSGQKDKIRVKMDKGMTTQFRQLLSILSTPQLIL